MSKKPDLSHLPSTPGVYLMKNEKDTILYIGKSVNLKNRVRSYFTGKAVLNFAKKNMVKQVYKVDYIQTKTDTEALILETNLIKEHAPKYNILMKDDKNLSYIKITEAEIPMVIRTRNKTKDGTYFGPYGQYFNLNDALKNLRRIFQLGSHKYVKKAETPCMETYIGICPGHCTLEPEKVQKYRENLERFTRFMKGETVGILQELEEKMKNFSRNQQFEQAQEVKIQIEQIRTLHERQLVRDQVSGDYDVVVILEKYEKIFVGVLEIRDGKIIGTYHYTLINKAQEELSDVLDQFLAHRYVENDFSGEILLEKRISDGALKSLLSDQKIKITTPKRGQKVEMLEFASNDLLNFAYQEEMKNLSKKTLTKTAMKSVLEKLGFEIQKEVKSFAFECYDISHHQGENTVASKVVIIDGKPDASRYKKYTIKTLPDRKIDDFASMHEVLSRRTRAACEGKEAFPNLIIIDGGKGQLNKSVKAIETIYNGFQDAKKLEHKTIGDIVNICSLAKREEEVFIPGMKDPILLEKGTPELMLLQKARDESHRFAINFHRQKRSKSLTRNILEEIPGIGPMTRKKLLTTFGSVQNLATVDAKELQKILTSKQMRILQEYGIIS